jgi:transcriptional regulator with XRE-family HTH domain
MSYLGHMEKTFTYSVKAPYIPVWTMSDRLKKARSDRGMTLAQFSALTGLSVRQILFAESGKNTVTDLYLTVVSAKTGVDYWWLNTGIATTQEQTAPDNASALMEVTQDGEEKLLGLDSNQEPIDSWLSLPIADMVKEILIPYLGTPHLKITPDKMLPQLFI